MIARKTIETISGAHDRTKQTESIERLTEALLMVVQAAVERRVEEMFPISTVAEPVEASNEPSSGGLVDALEIAKLLGRDVSSREKVRAARLYVYNLARQNLIPCVRISPRRIMFNPADIRRVIANGGNAQPYRMA